MQLSEQQHHKIYGKLVFFFQGYGDHQDLHSFPTRRSSDLTTRTRRRASRWPRCRSSPSHGRSIADRKSTRLNSSHRTISYAVFCLKKKKKEEAGVKSENEKAGEATATEDPRRERSDLRPAI